MSVRLNALLDKSFANPVCYVHFPKQWCDQDGFIHSYSHPLGYFLLRTIDVEPSVLFDLFNAESEIGVGHQNVHDQVLHILREEVGKAKIGFEDFLVQALSVLVLEW